MRNRIYFKPEFAKSNSISLRFQERYKTGLSKMAIRCEGIAHAKLARDSEADVPAARPRFVQWFRFAN
jgi:hypothetical protein